MPVIIRLSFDGSFQTGFHTTLFWKTTAHRNAARDVGVLPPNPELIHAYHQWQTLYALLGWPSRLKSKPGLTNISFATMRDQAAVAHQGFVKSLNQWLQAETFRPIREALLQGFDAQSDHQVFIQSGDRELLHLPWQSWELFETQAELEISVGPLSALAPRQQPSSPSTKVRILAILGQDDGIDTQADLQILKKLPGTALTYLIQPTRQDMTRQLWDQPWDILFFSGHSETRNERGIIHLNPHQSLAIADLKQGLKYAINQGLKLAIFNSCDGLGLAWELQDLQIPHAIVMREQVPDQIAQIFLTSFLTHFSQGQNLFEATRLARSQLEALEDQYPFASWLPTLVSNSATRLSSWKTLRYGNHPQRQHRLLKATLVGSVLLTGLLSTGRWLGYFQPIELASYDFLNAQRLTYTPESADPRLVMIGVSNADIATLREAGIPIDKQTIPDAVLAPLLQQLLKLEPLVVGYDFWREQPVSRHEPQLQTTLAEDERIVGVCQNMGSAAGIPPPPELPVTRVSFSNLVSDADRTIRRFLYGMAPSSQCPTDISFGLLVATKFLAQQGVHPADSLPLRFGRTRVPELHASTGGYALMPQQLGGHQTLIHYRATSTIAPVFSLTQVLDGDIPKAAIAGKIVLIGNLSIEGKDFHRTPIAPALSGVEIHGHVISQILSAVLDHRPLLGTWSDLWESLWILGWGLAGGTLACLIRRPSTLIFTASVVFIGLSLLCYLALLAGLWLVWIPAFISWVLNFGSVGLHRLRLEEGS